MSLKFALKAAAVVLGIWVAIQFSLVFIQKFQITQIADDQVLEALRMNTTEEGLIEAIEQRIIESEIDIDNLEIHVDVLDYDTKDIVLTLDYDDPVFLIVYEFPMSMSISVESGGAFDGS